MGTGIEMFDVGRVLVKPFKQGYEFIRDRGDECTDDKEALERIREFHRTRGGITQEDFTLLNQIWVEAMTGGKLEVNPADLVYSDAAAAFGRVRERGNEVYLHTSGSKDLIRLLIGRTLDFDNILTGEDTGDKNHPETFSKVYDETGGRIAAFYDDKPKVIRAAHEGFRAAGGNPKLYLVDRSSRVPSKQVEELIAKGVTKILSLDEI